MKKALLLCAMTLTGCGFHAPEQGPVNPVLREIHLNCGPVRAPLCGNLHNRLIERGYTLNRHAPYQLILRDLHLIQTQSPLGASVNRQYYDVNAVLTFAITHKNQPAADETVQSQKLAMTNANQIEGSQRHLQQVYVDVVNDLIDLLQIRIAHYENTSRATPSITHAKHSARHSHQRRRTIIDPRSR